MSDQQVRCAIVASTGGSVMNELLKQPLFRAQISAVISDRHCPAITRAQAHGVATIILPRRSRAEFCDQLLAYLQEQQIDYVISFYTRLFGGPLLEHYRDRIINMHPALLPAFKGLHGFEETLASGACYVGTSIHLIDEQMDEGKLIIQSIFAYDPAAAEAVARHRVFQQQCQSLLQVVKWLTEGRLSVHEKRVVIAGARYDEFEFSPNLDYAAARQLTIPPPMKVEE